MVADLVFSLFSVILQLRKAVNMEILKEVLKGIEGKAGKVYWINACIKLHEISLSEAGFLLLSIGI